jgi:hypothetical protein
LHAFEDALELKMKDSFDVATGQFLFNNDLYPSFESHLNGRFIRIAAIFYLPNAYFKAVVSAVTFQSIILSFCFSPKPPGQGQVYNISSPGDGKSVFMDGTELRVILELCRRMTSLKECGVR